MPRGDGPATLAKASTWQEHLVRPWRQLESSRGSSGHAELCRPRGGGRQGCPETPRRAEMPTDPSPRSPLWEGTPLYAAGDGQARTRGAGALTSTLPVPAPRGAGPIPGARTRSPHPGQARCLPPAPCQTFQPRLRVGPPGPRPCAPCRARPGRREGGARAGGGERAWAAPALGGARPAGYKASARWSLRLLLAQSISARRSPGARGARASRRRRTHLPAATCARREPRGKLCGPRGGGGRPRPPVPGRSPPPSPTARAPPAHLPRRRAAAAAAARPPASAGPWLRFPGPRAAAPRGAGGPGESARPGLGGPGGAARRGAHTAAATAQPAE